MNRTRIKEARQRLGLTLAKAGSLIGQSSGWLSEIERDKRKLSVESLRSLSRVYGVPVKYFTEESGLGELSEVTRDSLSKLSQIEKTSILLQIRDSYKIITNLEEYLEIEKQTLKLPSWEGAKQTAEQLRKKRIKQGKILESVTGLIEGNLILIFELMLDRQDKQEGGSIISQKDFQSVCLHSGKRYLIGVSGRLPVIERRAALAREFGMILQSSSGIEPDLNQAREFSMYLLLPEVALRHHYPKQGVLRREFFDYMSRIYGLPRKLILDHLRQVGLIDSSRYYYWLPRIEKAEASETGNFEFNEGMSYYRKLLCEASARHEISLEYLGEINRLYSG